MKPFKLVLTLLTLAVFNLLLGSFLAFAFGGSAMAFAAITTALSLGYTATASHFGFALPAGMLGAFTITDLTTAWGAYYRDGGQNEKDLIVQLFHGSAIDDLFTVYNTENTQLRKAKFTVTGGPQPMQLAFTPTGGATVTAEPIKLYAIKDDRELYPHEVQESWIGFMGPKNGETELTCPLPKYIAEKLYLPNHIEGMTLNEVYAGVYAAPTPGTAGPAGTSMDGIKKRLNVHIAASEITPIATGALATDPEDFVEQIEQFVASIDSKSRRKKQTIAMSLDAELRYRIGKARMYNSTYGQIPEAELLGVRHFPNIDVRGFAELGSSEKIFCSTMENSAVGIKRGLNRSRFQFEQQDRKIKMWTDYYKGYGWWDLSQVFTNDVELS